AIDGISNNTAIKFIVSIPNHKDYEGSISVSVKAANIVINLKPVNVTYGDAELTSDELYERCEITNSGTSLVVDLKTVLSFAKGGNSSDKGSYDIGYTIIDGNTTWYNVSFAGDCNDKAYVIDAKQVEVKWTESNFVYNGVNQRPDYEIVGLVAGDTLDNIELPQTQFINAGQHSIWIVNLHNDNYEIGNTEYVFEIAALVIEVEWNKTELVYNATVQRPTARITNFATEADRESFNKESAGGWSLSVAGARKNVGEGYIATINGVNYNSNYCVIKGQEPSTEFSIIPRAVEVTWSNDNVFTYNGQLQGTSMATIGGLLQEVDSNGLMVDTQCNLLFDGEQRDANTIDNPVWTIRLVGVDNPNYCLPIDVARSKEYYINPKEVSIVWGSTQLTYNGREQCPTIVADGAIAGESDTVFAVEGKGKNVGSYTAVITGTANTNYTIASGDREKVYTISRATVEIGEYVRPDWTYGETPAEEILPEIKNIDGITPIIKYFTDEACTNEYTGSFEDAPAGKYWVQLTIESTDNYEGLSKVVGSFEIKSGASLEVALTCMIATVVVLAGAMAVVMTADKKKRS
ncbi:MAG: hypothetical protein K2M44_00205, partial [Clostridia bacterium]|nr:hypothetical protein [Clostridia bacterium]